MRKSEKLMGIAVLVITALGVFITGEDYVRSRGSVPQSKEIIVIDPGHGGKDPGKVGVHSELEKDINLSISVFLKKELEEAGYEVIMTRESDVTATGEFDSVKGEDMRERIRIIEECEPICCISIHQNSYSGESVHGAQTFFHGGSDEGKALAEKVQENLIKIADPENTREIKSSEDYYILTNTTCPAIIVECGFLSNNAEALRLTTEEYQKLLAQGIKEGILVHFGKK